MTQTPDAHELWLEVSSGPPPQGWPVKDDGLPYTKVIRFERGPFAERAELSGDGRATFPYCIVVSEASGALPCWRTVQSALDALVLKGAMFGFWAVAGLPAPDAWRLRQVGALADTPAAFRFQLTTPGRRVLTPIGPDRGRP